MYNRFSTCYLSFHSNIVSLQWYKECVHFTLTLHAFPSLICLSFLLFSLHYIQLTITITILTTRQRITHGKGSVNPQKRRNQRLSFTRPVSNSGGLECIVKEAPLRSIFLPLRHYSSLKAKTTIIECGEERTRTHSVHLFRSLTSHYYQWCLSFTNINKISYFNKCKRKT